MTQKYIGRTYLNKKKRKSKDKIETGKGDYFK